jgi:hypothetical protein
METFPEWDTAPGVMKNWCQYSSMYFGEDCLLAGLPYLIWYLLEEGLPGEENNSDDEAPPKKKARRQPMALNYDRQGYPTLPDKDADNPLSLETKKDLIRAFLGGHYSERTNWVINLDDKLTFFNRIGNWTSESFGALDGPGRQLLGLYRGQIPTGYHSSGAIKAGSERGVSHS